MILTDDHAHMDYFSNLDETIEDQKKNNVKFIITQGVDIATSKKALAMSKKYDIILAALGIYPPDVLAREMKEFPEHYPDSNPDDFLQKEPLEKAFSFIEQHMDDAVAIGEVGLDYKDKESNKDLQQWLFSKFITLAKKTHKPIIIHSRKAESDVLEMLASADLKTVVLHCFSGKKKLIEEANKRKYYFSIPTNVTRSELFQNIVRTVDISRLLTETDAPFLSPFKDGKPNVPKNIIESIKTIAKIKGMTEEETANAIFQNFQRLYL